MIPEPEARTEIAPNAYGITDAQWTKLLSLLVKADDDDLHFIREFCNRHISDNHWSVIQ